MNKLLKDFEKYDCAFVTLSDLKAYCDIRGINKSPHVNQIKKDLLAALKDKFKFVDVTVDYHNGEIEHLQAFVNCSFSEEILKAMPASFWKPAKISISYLQ